MVATLVSGIREEHRLKVFENRMLRRIFGPKIVEVTGGYSLPSISTTRRLK
jgi:hypothetical protein